MVSKTKQEQYQRSMATARDQAKKDVTAEFVLLEGKFAQVRGELALEQAAVEQLQARNKRVTVHYESASKALADTQYTLASYKRTAEADKAVHLTEKSRHITKIGSLTEELGKARVWNNALCLLALVAAGLHLANYLLS